VRQRGHFEPNSLELKYLQVLLDARNMALKSNYPASPPFLGAEALQITQNSPQ
jgi:hypothetical protein